MKFQLSSILLAPVFSLFIHHSIMAAPIPAPNALAIAETRSSISVVQERTSLGAEHAMQTLVTSIVQGLVGGVQQDNENREDFTQKLVAEMHSQFPEFNWIICHPKHDFKFDGVRGVDWDHSHQEFDIRIGGTIGYEIYNFRSGEFTRYGDGGFINWAYIGNVVTKDQDGAHLVFAQP